MAALPGIGLGWSEFRDGLDTCVETRLASWDEVAVPGVGDQVGGFLLVRELGTGGFGSVYLGEDSSGRRAAVKLLHPHLAKDPQVRGYFARELTNARQVQAFCVAEILAADAEGDQPWLATEYIEGPTLGEAVRDHGPRTRGDLQRLAVQTITALAAIHAAGVVHRDLKPANILLGADGPRVIDFGIARALHADTTSATQIGTIGYMAPEQLEGTTLGPAADLFAWGAVLIHAATGADAFPGPTQASRINRVLNHPPDTGDLTEPLLGIVLACMDKDPAQRPTARQVLDMLLTGSTTPHSGPVAAPSSGGQGKAAPSEPTSSPDAVSPEHLDDGQRRPVVGPEESYARLASRQRELFRLLGAAPGQRVSAQGAAVLIGTTEEKAHGLLLGLEQSGLAARKDVLWSLPGLAADYAQWLARQTAKDPETAGEQRTALVRLLDHYTSTTEAADDHLLARPDQEVPERFSGRDEALAWLDTHREVLITAVHTAQEIDHSPTAIQLPLALAVYMVDWRSSFTDLITVSTIARDTSARTGDTHNEAHAWFILGYALSEAGRFEKAIHAHTHARTHFQQNGDAHGEAKAWHGLGRALRARGRLGEAAAAVVRAVALYADTEDEHGQAIARDLLTKIRGEQGASDDA